MCMWSCIVSVYVCSFTYSLELVNGFLCLLNFIGVPCVLQGLMRIVCQLVDECQVHIPLMMLVALRVGVIGVCLLGFVVLLPLFGCLTCTRLGQVRLGVGLLAGSHRLV